MEDHGALKTNQPPTWAQEEWQDRFGRRNVYNASCKIRFTSGIMKPFWEQFKLSFSLALFIN